jgi:hypothetical protein
MAYQKRRWLIGVGLLLLGLLLGFFILLIFFQPPISYVGKRAVMAKSLSDMADIGEAIVSYKRDHKGTPPQELGDLVPNYIRDPLIFRFTTLETSPMGDPDFVKHPELINVFSPYTFLNLSDGRVVVMQKPGFWKDGLLTYCIVPGVDRDASLNLIDKNHVTPDEFLRRYENNFAPDSEPKSSAK